MAHNEQRQFIWKVKNAFPRYFDEASVVEIGSLDINGSVRDFFTNTTEYIGVDLEEGPGVDLVCEGQEVDLPDDHFTTAISAECFEHNPHWEATFLNMVRMATHLVIFTCATVGRREHGTTRTTPADSPFTVSKGWDYYRNLTADDFAHLDLDSMFTEYEFSTNEVTHDLYFWGLKR